MKSELLHHHFEGDAGHDGDEVVLLLNGGMMTFAAWGPVTVALRDTYRVLGCDFRGQLFSPGDSHPRLEDHADDVIALLDDLGLDTVHVLGTSFGGEVALILAARRPERIDTLAAVTAVDRAPTTLGDDSRELQELARRVLNGEDQGIFYDRLVRNIYSPAYLCEHAEELAARRSQTAALPESWYRGLLGILQSVEDFDLTSELPRIVCPTLVIHAAADTVMPAARVEALAAAIDGAELAVHPESGHALVAEDPDWLVKTYRNFLTRRAHSRHHPAG